MNAYVNESRKTHPSVICFQHCVGKTFCFYIPSQCPECKGDLTDATFVLEPFTVPYPFIRASQYPCSVVIKPTHGDFLNDYYNSMDLHIGVTTSTGIIVEYDRNGLRRHRSNDWNECLLVEQINGCWTEQWDSILTRMCKQNCWTPQHYNELTYNCYTFVLTFLKELGYGRLSAAAESKTTFCQEFIVGKSTLAAKYISLFRRVKKEGCFWWTCDKLK